MNRIHCRLYHTTQGSRAFCKSSVWGFKCWPVKEARFTRCIIYQLMYLHCFFLIFRLTYVSGSSKQVWQVSDAACTVFELLMMSGKPLETCRTPTIIKNIVHAASCWLCLRRLPTFILTIAGESVAERLSRFQHRSKIFTAMNWKMIARFVKRWLTTQDMHWYKLGVEMLAPRYETRLNYGRDYVEY
jgi:hypothetical protein